MRGRTHSLLRVLLFSIVVLVPFTARELQSLQATNTVIIKIKDKANITNIAAQYSLTIVDSVPELNSYLVSGDALIIGKLGKDPNVMSIESDLAAEISEKAMLNESTVALLVPDTVALLDGRGPLWNSQNPSASSILKQ